MNKLLNLLARNAKRGEFRAEDNTLYVYDVIVTSDADAEWFGGVSSETFVKALRGMTGDVTVRVNSPGGDVFGGRAMAQAIRDHDGAVTVYVDGYAASAASFLTAAADRVVMAEGAFQMIHNAWTIALGNKDDFLSTAALLDKIDGSIADSYVSAAKRRGKEMAAADFAALMNEETWLSAQEAIDAGLADEVAEGKVKNVWDLSAYSKAPEPAPEPASVVEEAAPEAVNDNTEIARQRDARRARARSLLTA
jgi:ATP-dependent protease ClpP protease subunit